MLTLGVDKRLQVHIIRPSGLPVHGQVDRTFEGDEGDVTCKVCLLRWSLPSARVSK